MQTIVARIQETLTADFTTRRGLVVALPHLGSYAERPASARKILAVLDRDRPPDPAFLSWVDGMATATDGQVTFVSVGEESGEHHGESDVNPVVLWGEPAHRICHYADFMDADVIAIHETPRSLWSRLWWRSIADEVQALSSRPVLLVDPHRAAPNQCRSILCAVSLDGNDDQVLECATHLATHNNAEVTLLHVLPELSEGALYTSAGRGAGPLSITVAEERLGVLAARFPMRTTSRVLVGSEPQSIGRAARDSGADLVIVGRAQPGFWEGPCVDPGAVLRSTRCSVLSVPAWQAQQPDEETRARVAFVLRGGIAISSVLKR